MCLFKELRVTIVSVWSANPALQSTASAMCSSLFSVIGIYFLLKGFQTPPQGAVILKAFYRTKEQYCIVLLVDCTKLNLHIGFIEEHLLTAVLSSLISFNVKTLSLPIFFIMKPLLIAVLTALISLTVKKLNLQILLPRNIY